MAQDTLELEDKDVQEVRCSVTGVPIPSIPNWYATVSVNFVSDAARGKAAIARIEAEAEEAAPAADELGADELDDELEEETDDLGLEIEEVELEAEAEAEPETL